MSWLLGLTPRSVENFTGSQACFLLQRVSHQDWPEVSLAHPRWDPETRLLLTQTFLIRVASAGGLLGWCHQPCHLPS
jgi:hypothetical protein